MMLLLNLTILLLGLTVFLAIPIGIGFLLSSMGGWLALAKPYRATQPFTGQTFRGQSAWMRATVRYRRCLTFGADTARLYLSIFPLLRLGHPPLFIPWSEITIARDRRQFVDGIYLRFSGAPGVWLFINLALAQEILAQGPLQLGPT